MICRESKSFLPKIEIVTNIILICTLFSLQTSKVQFDKILSYIEHGKNEGATLLSGGKKVGKKGYYIEPTIFTNVKVYFNSTKKMKSSKSSS